MRYSINAATTWIAMGFLPSVHSFAPHATHQVTFLPKLASSSAAAAASIEKLSRISARQTMISSKTDGDDDNTWDFDENYDDSSSSSTPNLGINIGEQLDPLTETQIASLKEEATESINAAFDERLDEIEQMKEQVKDDFEKSKKAMRFASDLRAVEQTDKLMNKIDQLSGDFLSQNEALRTGIKMAARADSNMSGQGLEVGSWGKVGGMNVLTNDGDGFLGSVSANDIGARGSDEGTTESSFEVDTQVKGEQENRIMIICDDKVAGIKQVMGRFEELLNEEFPSPVIVDTYNPASAIPMGGKNAQCCIVVSTSLSNGQSSAETILGRVLKRTVAPGGGGVSTPPTHLIVVSPVGTERIEVFPYSMQNMMGGGKLKKAREVEESFIATVKGRFIADSSIPSLDYTILKLGEIVDDQKIASGKDGTMKIQPGDSLDGKVGVEAAANALLQAVVLQPNARNATLSVVGAMDKNNPVENETWDDWFLRLDGPELWRSEALVIGDGELERKFEELASYMDQWSDRFKNGAKGTGLTTPVSVVPSRFGKENDAPGVRRKFGFRLEFKKTNTGAAYKSKAEEKEREKTNPDASLNTINQKREGGIEILVEEVVKAGGSELRVRAKRCNMGDDTGVKEMSEETILSRLGEAVNVWKKEQ